MGRPHGRADLLKILADPGHEEYADTLAQAGGAFEPAAFRLQATNQILKSIRSWPAKLPRRDAWRSATGFAESGNCIRHNEPRIVRSLPRCTVHDLPY
jgi:hypothetical protein